MNCASKFQRKLFSISKLECIFYCYYRIVRDLVSVSCRRMKIWWTTQSAQNVCTKARLIRPRWFVKIVCFQKSLVSSSIWSVIFRRVYELLPVFLDTSRRSINLPPFNFLVIIAIIKEGKIYAPFRTSATDHIQLPTEPKSLTML